MSRAIACRLAALLLALGPVPARAQLAVHGETVHTMAGASIRNGVVLIGVDGRIERVGPASGITIPAGYRTPRARVVTPGLIDAHTVIGLAGYLNQPHDQDQLDRTSAIQPDLRAFDAYNAEEPLVAWVRGFGVTTLHTGHGPGALVSGQTMIVKSRGRNVDEAAMEPASMVAMTLGPEVAANFSGRPGTRAKGMALLRAELIRAQEYKVRRARNDTAGRNLGLDVLADLLDGRRTALITANRVSEILAALRLREEFGFPMVLDGAAEAYEVIPELRAAGVPVIIHPTMARHGGTMQNATFETAARLHEAGILVALQSGYEGYVPKTRVVLFEAAHAARYGMPFDAALATVTINAARVLGIADRVGSLEPGKHGDLALFDGDPFEYRSHACATVIEGVVVSEGCR
jgi:imidazolonepropionase-like amidohydrolase